MKVTRKERLIIQKYVNHYYQKFANEVKTSEFKNQMQLLHDYVTHLEVDN